MLKALWVVYLAAHSVLAAVVPLTVGGSDVSTGRRHELELRSASAKASVIVFLSARCPCSAAHEQALKDLVADFGPKSVQFLGVHSNSDEDAELTKTHFTQSAFPFAVIQDERARLANAFGALKTPHAFVISPQGEILFQGGVDDSHAAASSKVPYLRNALAAVLEGKVPEPRQVRALGCVIKR